MTQIDLLERLYSAHGGREGWESLAVVRARFSSGGVAYASRFRSGKLNSIPVSVCVPARRVLLGDYPWPGWWGEWNDSKVSIGRADSPASRIRERARERFTGWASHLLWDELDLLYFVGYALWNYLAFPHLLSLPGVELRPLAGGKAGEATLLRVVFPADIPTHSRQQHFHLDGEGRLRRHDYVAEVFGQWAAGANFCLQDKMVDGLRFYTRRRVVPSLGRSASMPIPTLVWIELDEIQVVRDRAVSSVEAPADGLAA